MSLCNWVEWNTIISAYILGGYHERRMWIVLLIASPMLGGWLHGDFDYVGASGYVCTSELKTKKTALI